MDRPRATSPLDPETFARVRESAIFECFKWDPQVEDVSVLAPFALTISRETWEALSSLAEQLARETIAAEMSLLQHEGLHRKMGFSRAIRKALRSAAASPAVAATRFMRFDFHYTSDGWRISEVNSDVPGGMNEASGFTKLMAAELSGTICGDPARELARAAVAGREGNGPVGLIHATAYADDRQVMEYMARELSQLGVRTVQLSPSHVVWRERRAWTQSGEELSAMLRFFPAEWLDELSSNSGWQQFFCAKTPSVNPAQALLSQCKRWPLYWDELGTHVPAWRRLLPQTVDPRDADWQRDASWVLKPAFGRVGDGIGLRGVTSAKDWRRIARSARWFPRFWVAQRRFDIVPVETSLGRVYPTFGVYVINERACGIYARCAASSLIDYRSHEAAVLIEAAAAQPLEVTHVGA